MLMQELVTLQLEQGMQVVSKMVVLGNGRKVEHTEISLNFSIFSHTLVLNYMPTLISKAS
jgi:hypothetical protein